MKIACTLFCLYKSRSMTHHYYIYKNIPEKTLKLLKTEYIDINYKAVALNKTVLENNKYWGVDSYILKTIPFLLKNIYGME